MRPQKIPMEWMGAATWRLPSGKPLAEFALQAGFIAPLLLAGAPLSRRSVLNSVPRSAGKTRTELSKAPR